MRMGHLWKIFLDRSPCVKKGCGARHLRTEIRCFPHWALIEECGVEVLVRNSDSLLRNPYKELFQTLTELKSATHSIVKWTIGIPPELWVYYYSHMFELQILISPGVLHSASDSSPGTPHNIVDDRTNESTMQWMGLFPSSSQEDGWVLILNFISLFR